MKKSQIHMMETISVLAIFFILVILVFIFYSRVSESNVEIRKEESSQLEAIKIAQKLSSLPELQCSQQNIITENCINKLNLDALSGVINQNEIHYFDMFSFSKITVIEVYPDVRELAVIYERPLDSYSSKSVIDIPISLFDPVENKNSFGVMKVELFLK